MLASSLRAQDGCGDAQLRECSRSQPSTPHLHSNNLQGHSIGGDGRAQRGEVTWAKRAPGNEGWRFAIAYSVVCAGLIASHFLQKAGLTDPVIEDKHAAALEKTISKASDASNSGKDFSFGSDDVPPEVKDMSTGHAISA